MQDSSEIVLSGRKRPIGFSLPSPSQSLSPPLSSPKSLHSHFSSTSGSDTVTATSPTVQPIAISNAASTFAAIQPFSPPSFGSSSSSSFSPLANPVDGPLHDLLPALSITPGASSLSGSSASGLSLSNGRPTPHPAGGRRVISGGSAYLASPSRSSPLSRSFDDEDDPSPNAHPWAIRRPAPFTPPSSPSSPPDFDISRLSSSKRRRRSSLLSISALPLSSASPPKTPPFGSLLGSFEHSLLAGRMSALPSHPLPFIASIGVMGSPDTPLRLRCPAHIHIPFDAVFYSPPGEVSSTSPYVGTVDLERHYCEILDRWSACVRGNEEGKGKLPRFPGYQVPEKGQLQLVLKNSNRTAFKPFLIPYDLTGLSRSGLGGRTFLRQKSYAVDETYPDRTGALRFAVHVQFCCPPLGKGKKQSDLPKYYLYSTVRVVFASRGLDASDKLRMVMEGPGEMMYGYGSGGAGGGGGGAREDVESFRRYEGAGVEWEMRRKKAKEREKMRIKAGGEEEQQDDEMRNQPFFPPLCDVPTITTFSTTTPPHVSLLAPAPSPPPPPPPAVSTRSPLALAALPSSLPPNPEPLTFERTPSPRLPAFLDQQRERKLSATGSGTGQSGLAASRPASANLSGERCGR